MLVRSFYTLLLCVLSTFYLQAQSSFIKEFRFQDPTSLDTVITPFVMNIFEEPADGTIKLALPISFTGSLVYVDLAPDGTLLNAYHLDPPIVAVGITGLSLSRVDFEYRNAYYAHTLKKIDMNEETGLFIHHAPSQTFWAKRLNSVHLRDERIYITEDNKILATHDTEVSFLNPEPSSKIGLTYIDLETTNPLWTYYYSLADDSFTGHMIPREIKQFPSGDFGVLHKLRDFSSSNNYRGSSIVKVSQAGELLANIAMPEELGEIWEQSIDAAGNLYLAGFIYNEQDPDVKDACIMKIGSNLELIWAKRLLADAYDYEAIKIVVDNDNVVNFIYSTQGDFPTIAGRISPNGDLLDYRGYAMYTDLFTATAITKDNEAIMVSTKKYYSDGSTEPGIVLMKTNTDGTFDNCETYIACLRLEDFSLDFDVFDWERQVALDPEDMATAVTPIDVVVEDFCPDPPFPTAYFSIADQICPTASLEADSLNNQFANNQIWHIQGPELDTLIDNDSLRITLPLEGTYMITQSVWVLGCEYSYSRAVEVVDEGSVNLLGEDRMACERPYLLEPNINFSGQAVYTWNTADINETITVDTSGIYTLSVEDYGCVYTDSVRIDFLDELEPSAAITFVADSVHCEELLPFALQPLNAYTDTFWLASKPNERLPVLQLNQADTYEVQAQVGDCIVSAEYSFEAIDCQSGIYLPNVFSPNDDGVNDVLAPLGKNFEGIQLSVYDRWGALVHQSDAAPFEWRAQGGQEATPSAVYMVVFEYVNKVTGAKEVLSEDVLLLR